MSNVEFSIVTVSYNCSNDLEKTINSVLSQQFTNYEFLVIDGGSSDGTSGLLKQFSNRIDIIVSESDLGIYDAMNKGVKLSTGKYIIFMNSGDLFYNDSVLANVFPFTDKYDVLYGDSVSDYGYKRVLRKSSSDLVYKNSRFTRLGFSHQSVFLKRSYFENKNNGFDLDFPILIFSTGGCV
jgi:glycosyltransferase involved in cell wall biosynthesis